MMQNLVIAIDGYSSCGKSTLAKALAKKAHCMYVDTGAMYRAIALFMIRQNVTRKESIIKELAQIHIDFIPTQEGQHVTLNGKDVEKEIRTLEVGNRASEISTIKEVREFLVAQQRQMADYGGVVMDGRDIGTVVLPNADLKLFMTARPEVRAQRRFDELKAKGESPVYEEVLADVNERDYRDTHRAESPLRKAEDAIEIDNSDMTPEEQLKKACQLYDETFKRLYKNIFGRDADSNVYYD